MFQENTIAIYQRLRFPLDKVFLTIEVVVKTWKNENAPFYERWSYKSVINLLKFVLNYSNEIYFLVLVYVSL